MLSNIVCFSHQRGMIIRAYSSYLSLFLLYIEKLRSKDNTKKELEQLLTTLQHCEQTFIQSPQVLPDNNYCIYSSYCLSLFITKIDRN